jgi:hypothetical protein
MVEVRFSVRSPLPPAAVLQAATDFSPHRPELWPNIDPKVYRVISLAATTAEAIEGSKVLGGIWAHERYDWSEPSVVRAVVQDSNIYKPGSTRELRAVPTGDGGSLVEGRIVRDVKDPKGHLIALMLRLQGRKHLTGSLQKTLAIVEREASVAG